MITTYSQSSVINYVAKNNEQLGPAGEKTVGDLGCFSQPVKTCEATWLAVVPLAIMAEKGYSSMGIITRDDEDDEDDVQIAGVISFKDIKAAKDDFSKLVKTNTGDYINEIRRTDKGNMKKDVVATVNVSKSDKLGRATKKLQAVGIHRLFIKGDKGEIAGIMTNSDILKTLLKSIE